MVWIVTLDYKVEHVAFGSPAMFNARNVNFSKEEAEAWVIANHGDKK